MSHHTQKPQPVPPSRPVRKAVNYSLLVEKIHTCLNEHLMTLMNQMLNTAGDVLFNLSEKAELDNKQMFFLDIIQLINAKRSTIRNQFFVNLNKSLYKCRELTEVVDETDLSLVEQDEMEEMVAVMTIHSQAMNLFGEEVNHLEARLEYLEINAVDIFEKDAIDPKHLCDVFKKTIDALDLDIEVKLVLYRLYNNEINTKLGVLYKSLNELFIKADVLPKIVMQTSKDEEYAEEEEEPVKSLRTSSDYYKNNTWQNAEQGGQSSGNTDTSVYKNAKQLVSQFLSDDFVKQGDDIPASFAKRVVKGRDDEKNYYPRNEVMKTLSRLQRSLIKGSDEEGKNSGHKTINNGLIDPEVIKRELLAEISNQHGGIVDRQVNLLDERSIDFVGMMFKAITTDESISKVISDLIMRLQIPVIKVAMIDQNLFDEGDHPAKEVLNLVSDAGKGVTTEEDRVYSEIESIVDTVVDTFEIDLDVFEEAVDSLVNLIESEAAQVEETEKAEQRDVIKSHARDVVVDKLKIFSSRLKLPESIRPLVLKHWSTLMLNCYIKNGKDSWQWIQSAMLLKLLLRCLQPVTDQTQYKLLRNNHEALVEAISNELHETRQDKNAIDEQVFQLQALFYQSLERYEAETESCDVLTLISRNDCQSSDATVLEAIPAENDDCFVALVDNDETLDDDARVALEKSQTAKQQIAELGSRARPGDWYKVYNGEDKAARRLKLSVILTEAAKLIFVDHHGVKVIEKNVSDFIEELNDERSCLIADHSAFDHALGQVIHCLAA